MYELGKVESKITPEILSNNKEDIQNDIEKILNDDSQVIVHTILSRDGGGSQIIVHAWNNGQVKPPKEIRNSLSSSSEIQSAFVKTYQITCVGCEG